MNTPHNLRLSGKKFEYPDADPHKVLKQVNFAYDLLRKYQNDNDQLRVAMAKAEKRLKFWRNLTMTMLAGAWALLIAILKAALPLIIKTLVR